MTIVPKGSTSPYEGSLGEASSRKRSARRSARSLSSASTTGPSAGARIGSAIAQRPRGPRSRTSRFRPVSIATRRGRSSAPGMRRASRHASSGVSTNRSASEAGAAATASPEPVEILAAACPPGRRCPSSSTRSPAPRVRTARRVVGSASVSPSMGRKGVVARMRSAERARTSSTGQRSTSGPQVRVHGPPGASGVRSRCSGAPSAGARTMAVASAGSSSSESAAGASRDAAGEARRRSRRWTAKATPQRMSAATTHPSTYGSVRAGRRCAAPRAETGMRPMLGAAALAACGGACR